MQPGVQTLALEKIGTGALWREGRQRVTEGGVGSKGVRRDHAMQTSGSWGLVV